MIRGETVYVRSDVESGTDPFGAPVIEAGALDEVSNVVVAPADPSDIADSVRPDGVKVAYTLHFPKSFTGDLRGLMVKVRGEWFRVVGDPQRYTDENVPGQWNMAVKVARSDG